jgi:CzcA family heavy metal efflux pump
MTRWIVGSSLRFRGLVVAIAVALLAFGIVKLRDAPVDALPEFAPPTVEIQTEALGLSASEVEQLITVPIEQDLLAGVAFVDEIRSQSVPGLSSIVGIFEPGTDILKARQVVAERLTQAHALPHVSRPPEMLQPLSSTNRVMMVGVSSNELSAIETSVLARWTLKPRLTGVPGVANVSIFGFRDRQLQIQVDPERLQAQNVTLVQLLETAGNSLWVSPLSFVEASTPGTGGFIDTANQRLGIQHISPIGSADDLARVTVEGTNLTLGDVATVVEDHQPLIGDANAGAGLVLVVEKFPEADTLEVTQGVEEALAELQPGLPGVTFDTTIYRPASYIEESIDNITLALIIGGVLLAVGLGLLLFEWRAALIAIAVIPLSLVVAGLVLDLLGETVNTMIVLGLAAALGLVVYDAIADVDTALRRLRQRQADGTDTSAADVILEASRHIRGPIAYATLIVALALVPVIVLEGVAGAFLPTAALAFLVAAAVSMAVALTVTPALSLLLFSRAPLERREPPVLRWLQSGYGRILAGVLHRPLWAYAGVGAIVVAGLIALPFLTPAMSPSLKETDVLVSWNAAPGTSLPEMNRITAQASDELRSLPGVRNVGTHVGRAVTSDQVVGINSGALWVSIDPSADYDATVAAVREVVEGYPGVATDVLAYSGDRVNEVLSGRDDELVVRLYGEDLSILRTKADEVRQALTEIDGVVDPRVLLAAEEPTIEVETDLARAQEYGIKPGDVRRAAATLVTGIVVGNLFEEQKVFDVVVKGTPEISQSLSTVSDLLIDTPDGGHVRLGDVADVRISANPNVITRQAISRYVDIASGLDGRGFGAVSKDVEQRLQQIALPLAYHAEVLAPVEETPTGQLITLGVAAAIGVLLLLQAAFGRWGMAAVALATLPLALSGGALGALANGGDLSLGSLMGFVAVLGIAARNTVLMITHFQHLELHEGETFGRELVLRAARERLAPILVTAIVTALALLPLAILGGGPGYELMHPMAVVVLGGVVTSTLIGLLVIPALYARFGSGVESAEDAATAARRLAAILQRRARARQAEAGKATETVPGPDPGS